MGKKNRSSVFEYYTGSGEVGKMMDRYNVEGVHYGHPDGRSGKPNRSMEQVDADIAKAMMKDPHTVRQMELGMHLGEKGAKKFSKKGFKGGSIYEAFDVLKGLKKDYVGGGGMNGPENIAGLTHALSKADRKEMSSDFLTRADIDDLRAELANDKTTEPLGPIEHSNEVSRAMSGDDRAVPKEDPAQQAASLFATDYKQDVAKGAGIQENRRLNLINAAKKTSII